MSSGTIGIIGCPILDDEIVYSLKRDGEQKNIYIVDTPPSRTVKKKLESNNIPFTLIDEWDFKNKYYEIDRENAFNVIIFMNKLGLHSKPIVLRETLEEQMRYCQSHVDVIALYYGMCGNAGWDVSEWADVTLDIPVFVFRDEDGHVCDDCIGVAVGGHSKYCDFVKKHPGMFYVTPSIAENWDEYAEELDFCKGFEIMDIYTVKEVFEVFGYRNAVKIDTGIGIKDEELECMCDRFTTKTGLEFITAESDIVNVYPTERIYLDAKDAMNK